MMNYSDYDSEDYSSNEDEDYVPSDDNLSEDDMNECEKEDGLDLVDQSEPHSNQVKKKKSNKGISMRKKKRGGLRLEPGDEETPNKQSEVEEEAKVEEASPTEGNTRQKKKADDLWASFLSDVGPRPKVHTTCSQETIDIANSDKTSKVTTDTKQQDSNLKEPSRITITKVFDFAGEEVRVSKEVDADSREARSFLKKENAAETPEQQTSISDASSPSSVTPGPSAKRPQGMSGILNRLGGKKQKMSTLEKSKLDWDAFKVEEGIGDELAVHNRGKDGYVERKNFLERVDQRQFELEKSVRLSNMKR